MELTFAGMSFIDDDLMSMVSDDVMSHLDSIPDMMNDLKLEPMNLLDLASSEDLVPNRNRFRSKVCLYIRIYMHVCVHMNVCVGVGVCMCVCVCV